MREDTLVLFTSDNGGARAGEVTDNGPLRAGKGSLYEGGVRVAACAAWPGRIPAGGTVTQPMHAVDVYPTVLKLAGLDPAKQALAVDGVDVWPALANGAALPERPILLNATPAGGAIRVGDWKLVLRAGGAGEEAEAEAGEAADGGDRPQSGSERRRARQLADATAKGVGPDARAQLFNLANDLGEQKDLAAEQPAKVKELRAAYDRLAAQAVPPKTREKPAGFKAPAVWGEQ
jgi:arylsulfatase A-like enzyme